MKRKNTITLLGTLMPVLTKAIGGNRPNIRVFKQLVINNAGREELEKAFIDYSENQDDA